jgi:hypothetical protein
MCTAVTATPSHHDETDSLASIIYTEVVWIRLGIQLLPNQGAECRNYLICDYTRHLADLMHEALDSIASFVIDFLARSRHYKA